MTEQEKELGIYIAECVNGLPDSGDNFNDCFTLAKAIIAKYPQITKKPTPVFIGHELSGKLSICIPNSCDFDSITAPKWIDQHYVEVVS